MKKPPISKEFEIYAAVYGKIAGATYWEVDEVIDPTQTNWYQMAIEANRKIIYTPTYIDQRLNTPTPDYGNACWKLRMLLSQ